MNYGVKIYEDGKVNSLIAESGKQETNFPRTLAERSGLTSTLNLLGPAPKLLTSKTVVCGQWADCVLDGDASRDKRNAG